MIRITGSIARDYRQASQLEWLITNGQGGFSSSTIVGANTRRYHGLLIASMKPPGARTLLLQKLEESVKTEEAFHQLSVNAYPGTLDPTGYQYLEDFRLDPFPVFRYQVGSMTLEKEVCLLQGENTVIIQYRLAGSSEPIVLTVNCLVNYRDFHALTRENSLLTFAQEERKDAVKITPTAGATPFYLSSDSAKFESTRHWYRNFVYLEEKGRGYDYQEDAFNPGRFVKNLNPGESINIAASTTRTSPAELGHLLGHQKREILKQVESTEDEFLRQLLLASHSFLVRRDGGASCIAGYHWFGGWGRDAMISLPGLTLVTGRFPMARLLLQTFAERMHHGLIPNYFSETDGTPHYNSLDATLWLFHAARKYFQYTKDLSTVSSLYPILKGSIEAFLHGTDFEVKAGADLLLAIGQNRIPLTWMDAKIGDSPVTPRNGVPVEINALWHSALDTMSGFAEALNIAKEQEFFADMADQVRSVFLQVFWNPEAKSLYDRVVDGKPDSSMRPNQIIAIALPRSILPIDKERAVVKAVQSDLLTPYGLRTLSMRDPNYKDHYEGDQRNRDLAYHQGSVWPWLLGPFVKAYMRTAKDSVSARKAATGFLEPMRTHLQKAGLGFISELFDGDAPFKPRGCIAQAWSVAEVLRAYYEDILDKEPEDPLADCRYAKQ